MKKYFFRFTQIISYSLSKKKTPVIIITPEFSKYEQIIEVAKKLHFLYYKFNGLTPFFAQQNTKYIPRNSRSSSQCLSPQISFSTKAHKSVGINFLF